jgi:Tol biopolymer transport system component
MRKWTQVVLILVVIAAAAITGVYWFGFPEVRAYSPEADSDFVAAGASIRLTFSRAMQPEAVSERLSIRPDVKTVKRWEGNTLVIEPQQPWESGADIAVHLAAGARAAGLLSLPVQEDFAWSFTIRQPRLLFLYPANGIANIYELDLKTLEREALTEHAAGIQDFSVDQLALVVYYSANNAQGGSDLYRLDLGRKETAQESSVQPQVIPDLILECSQEHCRQPVASPKGDFLAFERSDASGFPQVFLLPIPDLENSATGEASTQATVLVGDPAHQTLLPAWSTDGILAYYDTQAAAFVLYDPSTGERVLFPNQTGQPGAWHPDGRKFLAPEIFFLDTGADIGLQSLANSHLLLFDRLTKSTLDLTPAEDMEDSSPAFSPDGAYLAFARKYLSQRNWTPGRQLWVMLPEIGQAQPITDDPNYTHYQFAWSPDGKQLAYVRFDQTILTNPPEIWLLTLINAERTSLVENGYWPQWIP